MPQRVVQEEPIEPISLSSLWRSSASQMEVYRDRPAPTCAFILALAVWSAAVYRFWNPLSQDPVVAGTCLLPDVVFQPYMGEWRRYLLHALWPLEAGYIRGFALSAALLLQGYALEYEVGTAYFAGHLLIVHAGSVALLLYFRMSSCFVSLESALAGMAAVMHRVNPKVHTDGLDKSIRLPFAVEPRWHMWMLQAFLLLTAGNFPQALVSHLAGLAMGALCALRDPEVWAEGWRAARARGFAIGASLHCTLLLFTLAFMPLVMLDAPPQVLSALLDGLALQRSWWAGIPSSSPLIHMALAGEVSPEAFFISKLLLSLAVPLLLAPLRMWSRFYAGACVLLAMYAMTSPLWQYPHVGFVSLIYLVWAFWRLPAVCY